MKKFLSFAISCMLCLTAAISLFGCGERQAVGCVMQVSLNPSVEFVLDADNTVVSINASNEEGNLIIQGKWDDFVGLTDVEAVKLFVDISEETGFLVTGNVKSGENEIDISFSGNDAKKHFDNVKSEVDKYLSEENITATLKKAADLAKEDIDKLLNQCAPYIDAAKAEAMSMGAKLREIAASREETKELYSQELKNAYYLAKEKAFLEARAAYLKTVDFAQGIALETLTKVYTNALSQVETAYNQHFTASDSAYQKVLAALRDAKTDYLKYRDYVAGLPEGEITTSIQATLTGYEQALAQAETALTTAYDTATSAVEIIKSGLNSAYQAMIGAVNELSGELKTAYDNAEQHISSSLSNFEIEFATNYNESVAAANQAWAEMKAELLARNAE